MNTTNHLPRAASILSTGLAVALLGCHHAPLRHARTDTFDIPPTHTQAGADFAPPQPRYVLPPVYPVDLKRRGVTGRVYVDCLVDELGRVQDVHVVGHSDVAFSQAALEALPRWTFTPASRNGVPIALRVTLPIDFELDD